MTQFILTKEQEINFNDSSYCQNNTPFPFQAPSEKDATITEIFHNNSPCLIQNTTIAPLPSSSILPSQKQSFFASSFKYSLACIGGSIAKFFFSGKIAGYTSQTLGFCLGNFFSKNQIRWLQDIETKIAKINQYVSTSIAGETLFAKIMIPALCEEIEFRWLVQEIILRKLPKKIIEQISPQMSSIVDSMPAKISRIAATALLFAVVHAHTLPCNEGGAIYQLLGGLCYSIIYETGGNLGDTVNLHILNNLIAKFFEG